MERIAISPMNPSTKKKKKTLNNRYTVRIEKSQHIQIKTPGIWYVVQLPSIHTALDDIKLSLNVLDCYINSLKR